MKENEKVKIMNNILKLARERSLMIQSMLLTKDPFKIDKIFIELGNLTADYIALREHLGTFSLSPKERELYN